VSDFKAKMHLIRFSPQTPLRSLQRFPDPLYLDRRDRGMGSEGEEGKGDLLQCLSGIEAPEVAIV